MIGRIQDRRTFDRLRREGVRLRVDPLWCTYLPDHRPARVAFAIGRATGNAVTRNRLRRRLRAILGSSSAPPPGAALIGARPGAVELTFVQLEAAMGELVSRMHGVAGS